MGFDQHNQHIQPITRGLPGLRPPKLLNRSARFMVVILGANGLNVHKTSVATSTRIGTLLEHRCTDQPRGVHCIRQERDPFSCRSDHLREVGVELFRSILVDVEQDEDPAIRRAAVTAKATGASITLVDIVDQPPTWIRSLVPGRAKLPEMLVQECKERLERSAEPLRAQGLRVKTKVLRGKTPSVEIIREVLRRGHDLVIKHAETASKSRFFTITSDIQLLRKCPCPLWLVKPRRKGKSSAIVAAIAPAPGDSASNVPNTDIMKMAIKLSEMQACDLHVVRAWRAYGEKALRRKAHVQESDLRDYASETRQKLNTTLQEFLKEIGHPIGAKRVHLLKGHPGKVIPDFAKSKTADVVVLGSGHRKGVTDVVVGTTTQRILENVGCSVFAVKPEGFVSPVTLDES